MFEKITGHATAKEILAKDIENDQVSHAYLFSGIEGIGKKGLAIEFAKELLNTELLDACIDYKFIEMPEDKKEIPVDLIREKIVNDVHVAPATGKYKVYIINDAELMNASGQNALLKTLEEPPKYVVIILITNKKQELLTTVISRVKQVDFAGLEDKDIEYLLKVMKDEQIDKNKLMYANGSLKVAIELVNTEDNKYMKLHELYLAIKKQEMLRAMKLIEQISFKDDETFKYLQHIYLENGEYAKIQEVEYARKRMLENANEDILKQAMILKLMERSI